MFGLLMNAAGLYWGLLIILLVFWVIGSILLEIYSGMKGVGSWWNKPTHATAHVVIEYSVVAMGIFYLFYRGLVYSVN